MRIFLSDLKPGYYGGCYPTTALSRWCCKVMKCSTFHWLWLMKPVYDESGALVDYVTSESIPKGTAVSRVVGRKMKIYRLKGDPDIYSNQILDVHSEYGEMPYGWQMNFWTAIAFLAKYYFGKVIPVFKTKGINCISWVDFGSAQLGYNIIPEDEWVLESELEKSDKLEYVGDLEA